VLQSEPNERAGFSLLEALVAFTVLTLVLIATLEIFGSGVLRINRSRDTLETQQRLQNVLERLQAGVPLEQLEKEVVITLKRIAGEPVAWSNLSPVHVTLSLNGIKLETVLLRPKALTP
jgi:type II secretory pathway component PulJ